MWQFVVTLKDCEDMLRYPLWIAICVLVVMFLLVVSTTAYDYALTATGEHIALCLGLSVVNLLR